MKLAIVLLIAIPPFLRAFDERYSPVMGETFSRQVAATRCDICHAGQSKKNRNEYGQAVGKYLQRRDFTDQRLRQDPAKYSEDLQRGLKAAEQLKASDGKTYAERISAGQLPSQVPSQARER